MLCLLNGAAALLTGSRVSAVSENLVFDPGVFAAVLADQRNIRKLDRRFLLHDTSLDISLGIGTGVALDHLNAFDHHLVLAGHNNQYAAGLSAVLTTKNVDLVILLD